MSTMDESANNVSTEVNKKKKTGQKSGLPGNHGKSEGKSDRINQLPEDILYSIVSYFPVRDVANASVLSSRWRHLSASIVNLEFDFNSLFQSHKVDDYAVEEVGTGTCPPYKDIFVRGVNQFLQHYKGSRLVLFRVSFCLEKDSTYDIDQWAIFALSMGVEDLRLQFSCANCYSFGTASQNKNLYTLRSETLSHGGNVAKVLKLHLRSCILGPGVINQFSNLICLKLSHVTLGALGVESIISCCLNLESLVLENCALIHNLCIPASLHRLQFLAMMRCLEVEEIDISATNLTRFEYCGDCIKLSFSRAPNLKQIFFRAYDGIRMQYVFSQLAKDLPLVETLLICSTINWVQGLPAQITTFRNVKQLEFYSPRNVKFDLLKTISILKACPLMEKCHLVIASLYPDKEVSHEKEISGLPRPVEYVHKYLKEVRIGGFHFRASYIEFALYMLEYGVALEQMVIDPKLVFYYGPDCWWACKRRTWDTDERAKVCSRLQCHPKSSLIIIN